MDRIVVIGASVAGVSGTAELRRLGFDGEISIIGNESWTPYDRPPLTKAVLSGAKSYSECELRPEQWWVDQRVDLRLGLTATALDADNRTIELSNGGSIAYDGVLLATGASPRLLPGPQLEGMFAVRTLDDALKLRQTLKPGTKVVVVGGGFIGAEVAATANGLGCDVTILEAEAVPLVRAVGPIVGATLAQIHADEGVTICCGVPVSGVEGEFGVERVRLADGRAIDADVVVIGLGVIPSTGWLEGSAIAVGNGIRCDAHCRTTAPDVVAAGDVARWEHPRLGPVRIEHWENAASQGRVAAAALLGSSEPYAPVPYVWSEQYGNKIQFVGARQPDDAVIVLDDGVHERRFLALYLRGELVTGAVAINRASTINRIRRLLRQDTLIGQVTAAIEAPAASTA